MRVTRRETLKLTGAGAFAALWPLQLARPAAAQSFGPARHGLSTFGDLGYPPDFTHLSYVNPQAPKGGTFSQQAPAILYNQNFTTFNTLNIFILRGDGAQGMELTFDSLMTRALDEPDAMYALAAESVTISDDERTFRFRLRDGAVFHDGTPITAADIVYSATTLKADGHPLISQSLRDMETVVAEDARTVVVTFAEGRSRDLPLFFASLPILSANYYETRDFTATTLEAPLASGPYHAGRFEVGRFIEYDRVADYWGRDLPVNVGRHNFERVRFEYFRDRDVAFEGFKGRAFLFREEFTSRVWATGYDFPAIRDGRVKRDTLADDTPSGAQGWFINLRRARFADPRVREALILAFDFEWTNANLMFNSYTRTHSMFQNSDLMAEGPPSPEELALLEPHRADLPEEVFGDPFVPPVSDGSGRERRLLRRAQELLSEAGWTIQSGTLKNAEGEAFIIEFLDFDPSFEPHTSAYIANLRRLGISASIRRVDPAQYQARVNDFDFDMTTRRYSMSPTPGESLRLIFSSDAADTPGSRNLSGIKSPVIDALIYRLMEAETREDLTLAARALDRVIRAGRYWVPHWFKGSHWIAYWDEFDRPPEKPRYGRGVVDTWWSK